MPKRIVKNSPPAQQPKFRKLPNSNKPAIHNPKVKQIKAYATTFQNSSVEEKARLTNINNIIKQFSFFKKK
jgi:hypothetical protein